MHTASCTGTFPCKRPDQKSELTKEKNQLRGGPTYYDVIESSGTFAKYAAVVQVAVLVERRMKPVALGAEQNQLVAVLGRLSVVLEPAMAYTVVECAASAGASVLEETLVGAVRVARPAH